MGRKKSGRNMRPFYMFLNTEGMDQRSGPMVAMPTSAELVQNMHSELIGAFSAYRQGFSRLTAQMEAGSAIDGMGWYTDDNGVDYLLAAINGKVKNIDPATGTITSEIATTLTAGNKPDFEVFKGYAYMAEASISPLKWNGTGVMAATAFPLTVDSLSFDKPELCEKYSNRMVWGKFNGATKYPSHLVISDDLLPEVCTNGTAPTDGIMVQVSPGDGQQLVGLKTFPILTESGSNEILLAFKTRSLYALTGDTPDTFAISLLSENAGAVNNRSIVTTANNDVLWLGEDGIYSLAMASTTSGVRPVAVGSKDVRDTLATLNVNHKDKCWAVHIPERQEIWFAMPTGSNTQCDTIIVYHYPMDQKESASWIIRKNTTQTAGIVLNKELLTGDNAGYINQWFNSSKYDTTGINWIYRNHYYNFNSQAQEKQVLELFAWFLMYGPETMSFTTRWRGGGNNTEKTVSKTVELDSATGSVFGAIAPPAAVFGDSTFGEGAVLKKVKIDVLGNGEQLQLEVSGTTSDTGPIFLGYSGWVEYLGQSRSYK